MISQNPFLSPDCPTLPSDIYNISAQSFKLFHYIFFRKDAEGKAFISVKNYTYVSRRVFFLCLKELKTLHLIAPCDHGRGWYWVRESDWFGTPNQKDSDVKPPPPTRETKKDSPFDRLKRKAPTPPKNEQKPAPTNDNEISKEAFEHNKRNPDYWEKLQKEYPVMYARKSFWQVLYFFLKDNESMYQNLSDEIDEKKAFSKRCFSCLDDEKHKQELDQHGFFVLDGQKITREYVREAMKELETLKRLDTVISPLISDMNSNAEGVRGLAKSDLGTQFKLDENGISISNLYGKK